MLSESAVAEAEVETPSEVSTPDSEVSTEVVLTQDAPPAETGSEPPAPEGEVEAEVPVTPAATPEERLFQLDAKASKEGLTPEEHQEYKRVEQSVSDRRTFYESRQRELRTEAETLSRNAVAIKTELHTELQNIWSQNDGTSNGEALAAERTQTLLEKYHGVADAIYQRPITSQLERDIIEIRGDSVPLREWLKSATWDQKLAQLKSDVYSQGQKGGVQKGFKVVKESEFDKDGLHIPSKTKAVDDFKATIPGYSPPKTGDVRDAGANDLENYTKRLASGDELPSAEEIDAMTKRYLT